MKQNPHLMKQTVSIFRDSDMVIAMLATDDVEEIKSSLRYENKKILKKSQIAYYEDRNGNVKVLKSRLIDASKIVN